MDTYQISPRVTVTRGDAVRIAGKRGKFRFVAHDPESGNVAVVGPVGGAELSRTFRADLVRSAGRTPRKDVQMDPGYVTLSAKAHANARRR